MVAIQESLARFPRFEPHIVDAMDGKGIAEADRSRQVSPSYPCYTGYSRMTAGEFGCAMSHVKSMREVSAGQDSFAVILEDDVLLSPNFENALTTVYPFLSESRKPRILLLSCRISAYREPCFLKNGYTVHRVWDAVGGYGYAINKDAATVLAAQLPPFCTPFDYWHHIVELGVEVFCLWPHVASFRGGPRKDSSIDADRRSLWDCETRGRLPCRQQIGYFYHHTIPILERKLLSKLGRLIYLDKQWE